MSNNDDRSIDEIAPSLEEQVKFARKSRKGRQSTRFQKTTEFNVKKKLKKETDSELNEESIDQRLEDSLNREQNQDIFQNSLLSQLASPGKAKTSRKTKAPSLPAPSNPEPEPAALPEKEDTLRQTSDRAEKAGTHNIFPASPAKHAPIAVQNQIAQPEHTQSAKSHIPEAIFPPGPAADARPGFFESSTRPQAQQAEAQAPKKNSFFPASPSEIFQQAPESMELPGPEPEAEPDMPVPETALAEPVPEPLMPVPETALAEPEPEPEMPVPETALAEPEPEPDMPVPETALAEPEPEPLMPVPETALAEPEPEPLMPVPETAVPKPEPEPLMPVPETAVPKPEAKQLAAPAKAELLLDQDLDARKEDAEFKNQAAEFKAITGIELKSAGLSKVKMRMQADGQTLAIHEFETWSRNALAEAWELANEIISEYTLRLSESFAIEFADPNEITVKQLLLDDEGQYYQGDMLRARSPRLDELKALHRALEYSWPASFQTQNQLPMKVAFLSAPLAEDDETGVRLKYMQDGRPLLFISPLLSLHGYPTDLDPLPADNAESWQSAIMRELAWKSAVDCQYFPVTAAVYEALGWVKIEDEDSVYAIQTKDKRIYMPLEVSAGQEKNWVLCNKNGELLNISGDFVADESEVVFASDHELAERALVAPVGQFFFSIEDEIVEALKLFRQGPQWRAHLAKKSPRLYEMVKELDQMNINRCYPPQKEYSGMIRSSCGALVDNAAAQQKELAQFELKFLNKSAPGALRK